MVDYGENPWPGDFIADQAAAGVISRSMVVGGSGDALGRRDQPLLGGGHAAEVDVRAGRGLADRPGPSSSATTARPSGASACRAIRARCRRRALGAVSDDRHAADVEPDAAEGVGREERHPVLGHAAGQEHPALRRPRRVQALQHLRGVPDRGALRARTSRSSSCSTRKAITLHDRTLCAGSSSADGGGRSPRIESATGLHRDRPNDAVTYRAKTFVVASGYALELAPAAALGLDRASRTALANSSGLVGKYMNGHGSSSRHIELDAEIYPGMNEQHSLISRQFFRAPKGGPFVRHDLRRLGERREREPRLRDDAGTVLLGDAVMADWSARTKRGTRGCAPTTTSIPIAPAS